jgi:hypothetical protein
MESADLLIFTVYIIVVTYVFYQAYSDLGNQAVIVPDSEDLSNQIQEQEIQDLIDIKFKFKGSYRLNELTKLQITIQNKSKDDTIRVDWDECSITDFDNVTGRVVRIAPGLTDVPQNQATVIIVPGRKIEEELSDDKAIAAPLFKPEKLKKALDSSKPFFLRLFFKVTNLTGDKRFYTLRCKFIPKKLRWSRALTLALKPKKPKT